MHAGGSGSAGPVTCVGGFGEHRVACHGENAAVWIGNRRSHSFAVGASPREVHVDRDGRLLVSVPERGAMVVHDVADGRKIFDGGPETSGTPAVGVGGNVVAAQLASGGVRWWDLARNKAFELRWPTGMALSHGGTWLGVITPRGAVKILDPASGKEAVPDPLPSADTPARLLSFVNRRPDLLVVDAEHILAHYDLGKSVRENRPCEARDVLQFGSAPDRVWGITGGQYAALRLPEGDHCTIVFVDVHAQSVVSEITGLHPGAWVDAEQGFVLEPVRSAALLERDMKGNERRVLRALPDDEWVCFNTRGWIDASENAAGTLA
jgi:hypothetical protein